MPFRQQFPGDSALSAPKVSKALLASRAAHQWTGMNVLAAAAELIESDAAFALRIQTSEPVLVSIAKAHGHGAMSAVGMQLLRDRHDWSPTEVSAVVLAPYIFGTLGLHEEPPDPWKGRRLTPERGVPLAVSTVG